jgi:lysophospholipase L1-like esterase
MYRIARPFTCVLIAAVTLAAVSPRPITVFLAGDSTMAEKLAEKRPETGWGEFLQAAFDPGKVAIENHAKNGRSTRTFITEGLWQDIMSRARPGDYVFIQFGHNDESKEKGERYAPPADYRANLIWMVEQARRRGVQPVLMTPVMRRKFKDSTFMDTHGEYPDIVRSVAAAEKVPLIDMHRRSEAVLKAYGPDSSRTLFNQLKPGENPNYPNGIKDNTHFNPKGAKIMADLAIDGLKQLKIGLSGLVLRP